MNKRTWPKTTSSFDYTDILGYCCKYSAHMHVEAKLKWKVFFERLKRDQLEVDCF